MQITRTSLLSGKTVTKELPITEAQYAQWLDGELIQNAMPDLSEEDREFLISGSTAEEWNEFFKESN